MLRTHYVYMYVFVCVHAVSSGSITVNADSSVQLLAEEAVPLDQLDIAVSIVSDSLLTYTWEAQLKENCEVNWKMQKLSELLLDFTT